MLPYIAYMDPMGRGTSPSQSSPALLSEVASTGVKFMTLRPRARQSPPVCKTRGTYRECNVDDSMIELQNDSQFGCASVVAALDDFNVLVVAVAAVAVAVVVAVGVGVVWLFGWLVVCLFACLFVLFVLFCFVLIVCLFVRSFVRLFVCLS